MSADNYIYIQKTRKGKYKIWSCVASCVCHHKKHCLSCQKSYLINETDTLEKAIKKAIRYVSEYGISFELWCK